MRRLKRLCGDLIAACISIFILALAFTAPYQVEAIPTAPSGVPYSAPSEGTGRVPETETEVEAGTYTTEEETPENEPYIAPETQEEKENETIYQFTEVYPVVEEEYVEVLPDLDPIIETDIDALIVQIAGEYGLPWELVRAVVWAESTFDVYAHSDHDDYGLMQVSYIVWNGLDPSLDRYDPETNLRVGCSVLKAKIDANGGDFANGLTCYRFGDGGALEKWAAGDYNNWYVQRVLGKYYEYLRGER